MLKCTAEDIEEKRRQAREKLKGKKNLCEKTSVKDQVGTKSVQDFYPTTSERSKSALNRPLQQKQSAVISPRQSVAPYSKNNPNRPASSNNNLDKPIASIHHIFVQTISASCLLVSDSRFAVDIKGFHQKAIDVFKSIKSKSYDPNTKRWTFDLEDYRILQERMKALRPNVTIGKIPNNIFDLFYSSNSIPNIDDDILKDNINPLLLSKLLPFQKDGVCFAISRHGRVLIADEMGLGKTFQAIAIADFYREDWPILICATASTRDIWVLHVRNLLPDISCHHIQCLNSCHDYLGDAKVLVTSYNMLDRNSENLVKMNFGIVILDESHTLKNGRAKCTKTADIITKQAKRVILLSGTPALSRPAELFTQLKMIDRTFFNYKDYTKRYCDGKENSFGGWNAMGQSNLEELNIVLCRKYMIRRTKAQVLPELAEKNRETVILDAKLISKGDNLNQTINCQALEASKGREREELLLQYYSLTAKMKSKAVCAYLKGLVKHSQKLIVFAHHQIMMDDISNCLQKLQVNYVRIDGSTKNEIRTKYVEDFQTKTNCKVALLSLRACNTGITLTAANLIIFAELDWNPSTLAQAESRAHRIGQGETVVCRYLLAPNTADDIIWNMLQSKQNVLNKAGLFSDNLQDASHSRQKSTNENITKYFTPTKPHERNQTGTNLKEIEADTSLPANDTLDHFAEESLSEISTAYDLQELLNDDCDFAGLDF